MVLSGGFHLALGAAQESEWHDLDRLLTVFDLYWAGNALRSPFIYR